MHNISKNYYDFEDYEINSCYYYNEKDIIYAFLLILSNFAKYQVQTTVKGSLFYTAF